MPSSISCVGEIVPFPLVKNPVKLQGGVKCTGNRSSAEFSNQNEDCVDGEDEPILLHHMQKDMKKVDSARKEQNNSSRK